MVALPSQVSSYEFALILLGDVLVFVLIALATRLLSPRKLSGTIWIGPLLHLYTLGSVFLALYVAITQQPLTEVAGSFGAFLLSAAVGALIGRGLGHRIPVNTGAQGHPVYTGGKALTGLVIALLLPLALEQAAVLLGALAGVQQLLQAVIGAYPFNYLLVFLGSLFVLGTFVSITWRFEVWEKRKAVHSGPTPAAKK